MMKQQLLKWALIGIQFVLGASLIWSASLKLWMPLEKLAEMWPWAGEHPMLVKVTAIFDLLGAVGILLPGRTKRLRILSISAAFGILALMIAASVFHISRGESSSIGINIVFALLACFIIWVRMRQQRNRL